MASVNYALPFAAKATGARALLHEGWTIGTLIRYRSGYPFSAFSGRGHRPAGPGLGAANSGSQVGAVGNPVLGTVAHWFDPSAFVLPATRLIGTLARNSITGPDLEPWT